VGGSLMKLKDVKKGTSKYSVMAQKKKWKTELIQGKKYIRCNFYSNKITVFET
jgi:hypothetical protein